MDTSQKAAGQLIGPLSSSPIAREVENFFGVPKYFEFSKPKKSRQFHLFEVI
jgi:hypothetical protein